MKITDHDLESKILSNRFHDAMQATYLQFMEGREDEYTAAEGALIAVAAFIPTFAGACEAWHQLTVKDGTHLAFGKRIKQAIIEVLKQEAEAHGGSAPIDRDDSSL